MAAPRVHPDHPMTGAERLRRFRLRRKGFLPPVDDRGFLEIMDKLDKAAGDRPRRAGSAAGDRHT
jgi:hypothetical protein